MTASFAFGRRDNGQGAVTAAGTAQGTGADLVNGLNIVTTASLQTALDLPANHAVGSPIIVSVVTATTAVVFPPTGGAINGGTADASVNVLQGKPAVFFAHENGIDYTCLLGAQS